MSEAGRAAILTFVFRTYGLLLGAALASLLALFTHRLEFKLAVPAFCALSLLRWPPRSWPRGAGWVLGAFAFAALGDYFLSTRGGVSGRFVAGIGAYLVSHLGYIAYALSQGRFQGRVLAGGLVLFLPYYGLALFPAIAEPVLRTAVLAYLLVSCASLAAAAGLRASHPARWAFLAGISLIVFSDTLISLKEFLHFSALNRLILPTYYLALIAIAFALIREAQGSSAELSEPTGR